MRALSVLSLIAGIFALCSPALAHCRVTDLNLEPAISRQNELRQSANAQVVRDLRTLREAAFILEANRHTAECQRLVAVVRELVADPARAIETSGDTDDAGVPSRGRSVSCQLGPCIREEEPAQFEPSTANARPAWRLVSRVSGRKCRDDI